MDILEKKILSNNSVDPLRARVVAQGFTQILGVYYSLTFDSFVDASMV